jgi:acyl carrier protein
VVLRAGATLDEAGLRARCAYALAEYMVPQHVLTLDALPRLPNGKTDRKALPAPTQASAAGRAPADALEAEVSAAMAALLGLPEVGMEQSFFALGGHSLLAIQLVTRLNKSTGAGLKMRDIFEQASAEKVAALIRGQRDGSVERSELVQIPRRTEQSQAPQSVMQQRLFQLSELSPGRNVYNMPSAHRLRGPLDRDRLLQALSALVQRQPALRTRLLRSGEGLIQQVLDRVEIALPPTIDLSALAPAARQATLDARIDALIELPIALDRAPQWRLALFKLGADEHVLFLMAHHAIWDGWSFDVFYQEMAQLYPQPDAQLPALPLSYVDFAAWHLDWLRGADYQRQLDYWRQQLVGRRYSALPGDFARGAQMSGASQTLISDLPAELSARLQARAREWDATLYMLLLAAYAVSIERCMGLTQQLIGTPVRGRNHPDLEGLVGYFVNLVALPLQVDPTQDLRALVAEIKPRSIGAFANADVQLDDLLGLIRLDTGDRSARLYQASFSFQDVRARPGQWGALEHSRYETRSPGVTEDLAMFFVETSGGLHAILSYNSALFSASTMEAFRATLLGVLDALAEGRAGRIDSLPVQRPASALAPAATDEFATPLPTSAAASAPPEQSSAARAPSQAAEFEQLLITLWSELLPEVDIDPDATFFDLGGHSLLALSMVNRVEALCGRRLSLLRVGQTSLRGLALDLARGEPTLDHPSKARAAPLSWLRRLLGRPA